MVEEGEEGRGQRLGEAAGGCCGGGASRGRGEARDTVPHHDGQEAVEAGRPRHVNDGVELGKVGVAVQVDDGGEGLEGGRLDLHQVVPLHLQQLHQLLQQTRVQQTLYSIPNCRDASVQ